MTTTNDKSDLKRIVKAAGQLSRPYRIAQGRGFRLDGHRPGRYRHAGRRAQAAGGREPRSRPQGARRLPGPALRAGPLGSPAGLPGDGCRGQGRHDRARDVGRQSAGLPGVLVQGAERRRARPRLPLALHEVPARARAHRHLQPQLLRGSAGREGAPRVPVLAEAAAAARRQGPLGEPLSGHPRVRALPVAQRRAHPQVLPARVARGAEAPVPGAHRRAGEELEVLRGRRAASAPTGASTWPRTSR